MNVIKVLEKYSDWFVEYSKEQIYNHSIKNDVGKLKELTLNLSYFKKISQLNLEKKDVVIYLVILKKNTNEVIDYTTLSDVTINNCFAKIKKSILNTLNNNFDDYKFMFSIIPIQKQYKEQLDIFENAFYKQSLMFDFNTKEKKKRNFLNFFPIPIALFSIVFTAIQVFFFQYLINKLGFVDSIVENFTISNSIIGYLLTFMNEHFFIILMIYFLLLTFVFIFVSILGITEGLYSILVIFFNIVKVILNKIFQTKFQLDSHIFIKQRLHSKRTFMDWIKQVRIVLTWHILYKSFISYILFVLIIIAFFISIVSKDNLYDNRLNMFEKVLENYLSASAFPSVCKMINDKEEDKIVLVMGYDKVYTYYYEYEYINNILKDIGFKDLEKTDMKDYEPIAFYKVFIRYISQKINNSEIQFVKNTDYKIEKIEKKYYVKNSIQ